MTRIAVAGFQHETNTFAPFPTTMELFEQRGGTEHSTLRLHGGLPT